MAADFRAQLQSDPQSTFSLERELGGGGMSRVFLATENALGRRVVLKTVPGDMLSGAAAERFRREILTAARDRVRTVLSVRSEALTPYLTGEREYRHGRYAAAGVAFADAYAADTTFALAALRVFSTNGWIVRDVIPGDWVGRAWRHRDRLTGADSLLLSAVAGSTYPVPLPRRAAMRELGELAARANSAEVWFQYGD